jgi:adenylate cyclase
MTDIPKASIYLLNEQGNQIKDWPLAGKKTYRIGRTKTNDIVLSNNRASRQHAMLQIEENGSFNIIDLGSSNGTSVNGRRIHTPTKLRSGDLIQIGGKSTLTFLQEGYEKPVNKSPAADIEEKTVAFLEKEQVTILVCDIRNFTSLSEEIGDEKISDILKIWATKTNKVIQHYHGNVDKFIGDAVMATWIGKASLQESVRLALTCALEISDLTMKIAEQLPDLPRPLKVGGAINMGEAVVGNIGVDGNRDYTVIGDVVNITFRLEEETTKIGRDILIGSEAACQLNDLTDDTFTPCKYIVKGKKDPVTAYSCNFDELREYLAKN